MLVRAFRLTDKLSNALLKLQLLVVRFLLVWASSLRRTIRVLLDALFGTTVALVNRADTRRRQLQREIEKRRETSQTRALAMVQRTAAGPASLQPIIEEQNQVIEDPLIARNRTLSAFAVVLLFAIILVILWQPAAESDTAGLGNPSFGLIPTNPISGDDAPVIPSPLPSPSATNRALASLGGTLAFTLRQNGQDDLWALPAGSSQAIRLTDSPTDDRDPAWSRMERGWRTSCRRRMTRAGCASWTHVLGKSCRKQRSSRPWTRYCGHQMGNSWCWPPTVAGQIYSLEIGSDELEPLTQPAQQRDLAPLWSPDGRRMAFIRRLDLVLDQAVARKAIADLATADLLVISLDKDGNLDVNARERLQDAISQMRNHGATVALLTMMTPLRTHHPSIFYAVLLRRPELGSCSRRPITRRREPEPPSTFTAKQTRPLPRSSEGFCTRNIPSSTGLREHEPQISPAYEKSKFSNDKRTSFP
ncbi:MAG: hypothetical protein HC915_03310, partial [Anaerolineae bacterium]|nr:hypothetical protein [Anaerolineae bacterium]